jgi:hypothetical protein
VDLPEPGKPTKTTSSFIPDALNFATAAAAEHQRTYPDEASHINITNSLRSRLDIWLDQSGATFLCRVLRGKTPQALESRYQYSEPNAYEPEGQTRLGCKGLTLITYRYLQNHLLCPQHRPPSKNAQGQRHAHLNQYCSSALPTFRLEVFEIGHVPLQRRPSRVHPNHSVWMQP